MTSHAEVCPVCSGTGKKIQTSLTTTSAAPIFDNCHGCSGYGWVTVCENTVYPYSDSTEGVAPQKGQDENQK